MHLAHIIIVDILWATLALLATDFISGLVHWAEDTWTAPGRSALLDRWIVTDNIEHHRHPASIRAGNYWATNRACIVGATLATCALVLLRVHAWQPYLIGLLGSQANQVHKWAHSADRPAFVRVLQSIGVLQSRKHHGRHHLAPYARRFCAYTNFLNPLLDGIGFWRGLEALIAGLGVPVQRGRAQRGGY